jgi:hypothetical protein
MIGLLNDPRQSDVVLPFKVKPMEGNKPSSRCSLQGRDGRLRREIVVSAEDEERPGIPGTVRKAVVAIPAYFKRPQRQATRTLAPSPRLPQCCASADRRLRQSRYGLDKKNARTDERSVLIFDLGGGVRVARPTIAAGIFGSKTAGDAPGDFDMSSCALWWPVQQARQRDVTSRGRCAACVRRPSARCHRPCRRRSRSTLTMAH